MSTLIRTGECNHCGKCCLREGGVIVENPMIELHEDRCKFYVEELNNQLYGHCLIQGRGNKPIKTVSDRFGNKITNEQIGWFEQNCIDYPSIEDGEKGYKPPSGCSFKFELKVE